jgi:hypothetical protein
MHTNDQITSILQYSDISLFLGADEYEIEKYYNWVDETDRLELIYIMTDVLRYFQPYYNSLNTAIQSYYPGYTGNPTYDRLINFIYAYIGHWVQNAAIISGSSTGIVTGQPTSSIITNVVYAINLSRQEYTATGGETSISYPSMAGRSLVYVSRGGATNPAIITTGTPNATQVLWNTNTGQLTFGSSLGAGVNIVSLFN